MRHIFNVLTTSKENDHIAGSLVLKEIVNYFWKFRFCPSKNLYIEIRFFLELKKSFFFFFG
jgi:hypothetical protein